MSDDSAALVAEQLRHILDQKQAEINGLRSDLAHYRELTDLRLFDLEKCAELHHYQELTTSRLADLEEGARDRETRLRSATEGVTQFRIISGITSGGSVLFSLIALLKSFLMP